MVELLGRAPGNRLQTSSGLLVGPNPREGDAPWLANRSDPMSSSDRWTRPTDRCGKRRRRPPASSSHFGCCRGRERHHLRGPELAHRRRSRDRDGWLRRCRRPAAAAAACGRCGGELVACGGQGWPAGCRCGRRLQLGSGHGHRAAAAGAGLHAGGCRRRRPAGTAASGAPAPRPTPEWDRPSRGGTAHQRCRRRPDRLTATSGATGTAADAGGGSGGVAGTGVAAPGGPAAGARACSGTSRHTRPSRRSRQSWSPAGSSAGVLVATAAERRAGAEHRLRDDPGPRRHPRPTARRHRRPPSRRRPHRARRRRRR